MTDNRTQLYSLMPPESPLPAPLAFVRHARFRLQADYLAKITQALEPLTAEQIWWRPNAASNSIGNLLLHLAGNIRQWLIAGVGGVSDVRMRAAEFTAAGVLDKEALLGQLTSTVAEADAVLEALAQQLASAFEDDAPLQRLIAPQGVPQTVLDAVFHVVEHFSYHTGQIIFIAKQVSGVALQFYDEQALNRESAR